MSVGSRSENFSIVSNDHGLTQMCNFCVSVGKTNFTDHHTLDPIIVVTMIQWTVLAIQFSSVKCTASTVPYAKISSISISHQAFSSSNASGKRLQWLDYMKTNHFKMLLNVCGTTYAHSNCIVYRLFYCSKIT